MSDENIDTTAWWERYRTDATTDRTHHIDVFFRSLAPSQGSHDKRRRILQQLEKSTESPALDSYEINVVGDGLCLCDDCAETRIARHMHETLSMLRNGGSEEVKPTGFSQRTVDSDITGEHYSLLVPPEVSLAVYVEDSLRGVFPAVVDGVSVSVTDFLDALSTFDSHSVAQQAEA